MLFGGYQSSRSSPASPTIEIMQSPKGDRDPECSDGAKSAEKDFLPVPPLSETKIEHKDQAGEEEVEADLASAPAESASPGASQHTQDAELTSLASSLDAVQTWEVGDTPEKLVHSMTFTGLQNTGVMFASDAAGERCSIEGNCCVALAQSALKDEVLERLGATKEILSGLIHVLNTGTEWAAASAARAIGNIAYRSENLNNFTVLLDEVARDRLISGLANLLKDEMRPKSKEYSASCIANMLVHDALFTGFNRVKGLKEDLSLLQKNSDPAISTEATRAVTIINQARFGTISWRASKRI